MKTEKEILYEYDGDPLGSLKEFCKAYSRRESEELFCQTTLILIRGTFPKIHDRKKALLLDFLEELEKIIPALYEIQAMGRLQELNVLPTDNKSIE